MTNVFDVNMMQLEVNASSYAAALEAASEFIDNHAFHSPDFQSDDEELIPSPMNKARLSNDGTGHWVLDMVRVGVRADVESSCHSSEVHCSKAILFSPMPSDNPDTSEAGIDWSGLRRAMAENKVMENAVPTVGAKITKPHSPGI